MFRVSSQKWALTQKFIIIKKTYLATFKFQTLHSLGVYLLKWYKIFFENEDEWHKVRLWFCWPKPTYFSLSRWDLSMLDWYTITRIVIGPAALHQAQGLLLFSRNSLSQTVSGIRLGEFDVSSLCLDTFILATKSETRVSSFPRIFASYVGRSICRAKRIAHCSRIRYSDSSPAWSPTSFPHWEFPYSPYSKVRAKNSALTSKVRAKNSGPMSSVVFILKYPESKFQDTENWDKSVLTDLPI